MALFVLLLVVIVGGILYFAFFSEVNQVMGRFLEDVAQRFNPQEEVQSPDPGEQEPEDPDSQNPPEQEPPEEPDPEPEPPKVEYHNAYFAGAAGFAAAENLPDGADALVIDFKTSEGLVMHLSQDALIVQAGGISPDAVDMRSQIAALKEKDIYLIARISCFKDQYAPRNLDCPIRLNPTTTWLDAQYERWMDPYKEPTKQYLTALAKEAAGLGFDEILLDDLNFPVYGKLNLITYETGGLDLGQALQAVVAAVKAGLPEEVKLSVAVENAGLRDASVAQRMGQDFELTGLSADYLCPELDTAEQLASFLTRYRDFEKLKPIYRAAGLVAEGTAAGVKQYNLEID